MKVNLDFMRFAAEAAAIIAAAVIAGPVLHLMWWQVGFVVFLVLGAGILLESVIANRQSPAAVPAPPPQEPDPDPDSFSSLP